jgi:hypothetical protein
LCMTKKCLIHNLSFCGNPTICNLQNAADYVGSTSIEFHGSLFP